MPKFPAFGKRKSAMPKEDGDFVPSFRVLERADQTGVKSFDDPRAVRRPVSMVRPYSQVDNLGVEEENMFVNLNANRYVVFFLFLSGGAGCYYGHLLKQITPAALDHTPVYSSKR